VPPVASLRHLSGNGWDVHLLCEHVDPDLLDGVSALPADVALRHVHPPPAALRAHRRAETSRLVRLLARQLARHPIGVARAVRLYGLPTPDWAWNRYFDALLVALEPRLVHFHTPAALAGRKALLHLLGARVVVSVRDADLPPVDTEAFASWQEMIAIADGFSFTDETVQTRAVVRGLSPERPWTAGTSAPRRVGGDRPGDRLRLLSIGDLSWRQGYEHALHAVRLLLDRGLACEYRLVGHGEHAGALRFARYQLGLEGHVELVDPRVGGPVVEHLRWADVFLHPAVADGPLGAVAEAAALRVPVVATVDLLPDIAAPSLLRSVPRRDPWAIAQAVTAAVSSAAPRISPISGPELSLEECLRGLENLYRAVLDGPPASRK
jgi:colanic acid/amylovoran biosynthesis glycosyltransferase